MIRKQCTYLVAVIICMLMLCSCGPKNPLPQDELPDIGVPSEEINTRFRIFVLKDSENTFKNKDALFFVAQIADSDHPIVFDAYTYVRMFTIDEDEWIEVPYQYYTNETGNPDNHYWLFSIDPDRSNYNDISIPIINPDIPDLQKATWYRVFLIGSLYENELVLDQKTAAYMDILVKP